MNIKKWLATKLAGKDPVDDVKEKADAALTHFDITKEDIEREKAKMKKKETERKKKRQEKISEIEECSKKVHDSINTSPNGKRLTKEEAEEKMRELGWRVS